MWIKKFKVANMRSLTRALTIMSVLVSLPAPAATFEFEFSQPGGEFFNIPGSILLLENDFVSTQVTVHGQPTLVLRRISQGRESADPAIPFANAQITIAGQNFPLVFQPFSLPGTKIGTLPDYGADPLADIMFGGYDPAAMETFSYPVAALGDFGVGGPNLSYDGIGPFTGTADTLYFAIGGSFTSRPDIYSLAAEGGVPEPAAWLLMIVGFGMVGIMMRRRSHMQVTYGFRSSFSRLDIA